MITRTVKIPDELVREIDRYIEMKEYSTRADFVLHALRSTVANYAEIKRKLINKHLNEVPPESEIEEAFSSETENVLLWLKARKGEMIQINTRVPEGLEAKIDILVKPEYGFKKKSDFTRVAIAHLITILGEAEGVFGDAEKFAQRTKEIAGIFTKLLEENLPKGKTIDEIYLELEKKLYELGY